MLAETGGPLTAAETRAADRTLGVPRPNAPPLAEALMAGITLDAGSLVVSSDSRDLRRLDMRSN